MADALASVEARISTLEKLVFGSIGSSAPTEKDDIPNVADDLADVRQRYLNMLTGKDKVKHTITQIMQNRQYLEPNYIDQTLTPIEAVLHLVELQAPAAEIRLRQLEQIKDSEVALNSEHIKNVPAQQTKLAQLSLRQAEQTSSMKQITSDISDFLNRYNELIVTLSKQFIFWDQMLTEMETKSQNT